MKNTYETKIPSILIVDDDKYIRILLEAIFEEEGFTVNTASNGKEAVEKVGVLQPMIVIMDFDMPIMNGVEATKSICEKHPLIPIVMLTANRTPELLRNAQIAGATKLFHKPIKNEHLVTHIRKLIYCAETA
ncbi:response regulator [Candidatus Uabimicrobium sp. HlEnr_7]|uniref:response regulator n=1 Tax=Candidatus Uabimicrobium helgolandensis TaxID=3095367 RepID=UPI003558D74A